MEVLDVIYLQFFFTANSLGHQPSASQYFQPLALQTLALVVTAIHCALSEYARRKKATVMLCQDEYRGTLCPFAIISLSPAATAKSNHIFVGPVKPPPPPSPHHVTQLRYDRRSSTWIHSLLYPSAVNSSSFSSSPLG